jgi:hypothetical protein
MTLSTLALAVALAAVVVLIGWVLSLHRQVRRLAAAVESAAPSAAFTGGSDAARATGRHERAAEGTAATVPVITAVRLRPVDRDGGAVTNSRVASVTLGEPLIKLAALSHGVRRALDDEHRLRLRLVMRRELRRQRKLRRRRAGGTTGAEGWSA